ncbi:MAG: hypothetical protein AAEJ04_07310, partial [Planctomycetota bacterium]
MKRISFFLGVFSVGLVVFLLLTGQFGGLESASNVDPAAETFPEVEQNRVTHHSYDYSLGRLRFTLRGEMDLSSGLVLSADNLVSQRALLDATIELPVYAEGRTEPVDQILFEAEKIITDPGGEEARVIGELRGRGAGGAPEMETRDLRIRWADGEDILIDGKSPVQVAWPEMLLRSAHGLVGSIGSSSGLQELSFSPPVIVAMNSLTWSQDRQSEQQLRIVCDGPITLAGAEQGARFDGGVRIFEAPISAPMNPRSPPPLRHIAADFLDLQLEPKSRRLLRIHSERRESPIVIQLGGGIRVEGEKLDWKDGDAEVALTDGVSIFSKLGVFQAQKARVQIGSSRCIVEGGVTGILKSPASGSSDATSVVEGDWTVAANSAQFEFADGKLTTLSAHGRNGESVSIQEFGDQGATIVGDELRWRALERELEVLSGGENRALFTDGRNRIESRSAALSLDTTRLVFRDQVAASLAELPRGPEASAPQWLGDEAMAILQTDILTMNWDGKKRLKQLEATAVEMPLQLRVEGRESLQLSGSHLIWRGADALIRIDGSGRQTLSIGTRADLKADRLSLSMIEGKATGEGSVEGTLQRPRAAADEPPVEIHCRSLVVSLGRSQTDGEAAATADATATAVQQELPLGRIQAVRAVGDLDSPVRIDDGTIRALGQELLWNATEEQFRFQGPGLQQVEVYSGTEVPDRIEAETISLDRNAGTAELVGDARALVYLAKQSEQSDDSDAVQEDALVWQLSSDRIDAGLKIGQQQIQLQEVVAQGTVRLAQEEGGIEFRGQRCQWDHLNQRLVLSSADGQGLQTFVRGDEPHDEVVAREVVVVRSTPRGSAVRGS